MMSFYSEKDVDLAKMVILEELRCLDKTIENDRLNDIARDVLDTSYSIGGSFDVGTIRKIVIAKLKRNILV